MNENSPSKSQDPQIQPENPGTQLPEESQVPEDPPRTPIPEPMGPLGSNTPQGRSKPAK